MTNKTRLKIKAIFLAIELAIIFSISIATVHFGAILLKQCLES